jgi:hypothetical protein
VRVTPSRSLGHPLRRALRRACAQALVAFTEAAGEQTNKRGTLSNEQAQKFAGKYLEDIEADQSGTINDVVAKMEAALAEKSEAAVVEEAPPLEKKGPNSDGW